LQRPHPVRVAIDGPDAAGTTTLTDELAAGLKARGREVIRASIDGFHRPRAERYRRGADSPEGYYRDSFDHDALRAELLDPLGPDGSSEFRTAVFNFRTDFPRPEDSSRAAPDAVLLLDGVFLLRPELRDAWDLRIFVRVEPAETLRRALARDVELFGSPEEVERRYRTRYLSGQQLYLEEARPLDAADMIVVNDDPTAPRLSDR
jgi:uridine kinase